MNLSNKAREDLRQALVNDIGAQGASEMTDEDLDHIGDFLLTVVAESLKMKMNDKQKHSKNQL